MLYLLDSSPEISCWGVGGEGSFLISNIFESGYESMSRMQLFDQVMPT